MSFDHKLSTAAAAFGRNNPDLYFFFETIGRAYSFKTLPFVVAIVLIWFLNKRNHRIVAISSIVSTFVTLVVSRLIQNLGPHRPRPAHTDGFSFYNPSIIPHDWSSFPSDTAACIGAFVVAIWIANRWLGLAASIWAIIVLAISKFVTGAHFITDMLAGFTLGGVITIACYYLIKRTGWLTIRTSVSSERYSPILYAFGFLVIFQISTFFDDVRQVGSHILNKHEVAREHRMRIEANLTSSDTFGEFR